MKKYTKETSAIMLKKVKDFLHDSFGHYIANSMDGEDICCGIEIIWGYNINPRQRELIPYCVSHHASEWENYSISDDGATPFEEYQMQCIEDKCVEELLFYVFGNAENLND
jgi:hypothetical protein